MMKITGETDFPSIPSSEITNPSRDSDLLQKPGFRSPPRRRTRKHRLYATGVRLKRDIGAPEVKRSRPETPLLHWKFNDRENSVSMDDEKSPPESSRKCAREIRRGGDVIVSARKLAAELWRLHLPEVHTNDSEQLGFSQAQVGHVDVQFLGHQNSKACASQFSNSSMEGATKWDPACVKTSDKVKHIYGYSKFVNQRECSASVISALEGELEQTQARIHELESEQYFSKKKLDHFLKKLREEKTTWQSREYEKVRAIIDDMKADLSREKKNRQRMEIVNSKLVNELAEAKLSAKRYMQDYEKEWKARELVEEVCDELAKEIAEDKAEVEALKRESMKLQEEVEEEKKILQMAEVWREERVQMKLVDAKVALEEKYSQMNRLVVDLESFLKSRNSALNVEETRDAEVLCQAAASVNVEDIKEFSYEPPNPDNISSIFEAQMGEPNAREIEPFVAYSPASHASKIHTVTPMVNIFSKSNQRHSDAFVDHSDDVENNGSGIETVSYPDDQDFSYSQDASDSYINKTRGESGASGSGIEWEENAFEETPNTEISEVSSVPARKSKVLSISRLWRSRPHNGENYKIILMEGKNGKLSNVRLSNGEIISPDQFPGKGGFSPLDLARQWSSPDSEDPHVTRGMKGCIEWPCSMQKYSLKTKLLEARTESQKIQLRQVLK